ncbi:hypothetical protein [Actinoplanes sp. NPDC051859]|uniref:hypothetical protein n=1 Tax=Actinoplanes sp. NPDC051859 TaxID=3363909 RepID=UPI0037B9D81F
MGSRGGGSGALVLHRPDQDAATLELVAVLGDRGAWAEAVAERTMLHTLQGNCPSPIGALARTEPDGRPSSSRTGRRPRRQRRSRRTRVARRPR